MKVYFTAPTMDTALHQMDLINRTTGLDLSISEALIDERDVELLGASKFKYIVYDDCLTGLPFKARERFYNMSVRLDNLSLIGQCKKVYMRNMN